MNSPRNYCVVCKKDTENKNPKVFKTINGRLIYAEIKNQDLLVKIKDQDYYQSLESELL